MDCHWTIPQENLDGYIEKVSRTTDNFVLGTVSNPTSNAVSLEEKDGKFSYDIFIYSIESSYNLSSNYFKSLTINSKSGLAKFCSSATVLIA